MSDRRKSTKSKQIFDPGHSDPSTCSQLLTCCYRLLLKEKLTPRRVCSVSICDLEVVCFCDSCELFWLHPFLCGLLLPWCSHDQMNDCPEWGLSRLLSQVANVWTHKTTEYSEIGKGTRNTGFQGSACSWHLQYYGIYTAGRRAKWTEFSIALVLFSW